MGVGQRLLGDGAWQRGPWYQSVGRGVIVTMAAIIASQDAVVALEETARRGANGFDCYTGGRYCDLKTIGGGHAYSGAHFGPEALDEIQISGAALSRAQLQARAGIPEVPRQAGLVGQRGHLRGAGVGVQHELAGAGLHAAQHLGVVQQRRYRQAPPAAHDVAVQQPATATTTTTITTTGTAAAPAVA